jgi:hypothetical protein
MVVGSLTVRAHRNIYDDLSLWHGTIFAQANDTAKDDGFQSPFLMRRRPLWGLFDAVKIHRARNPAESVGKCRHEDET